MCESYASGASIRQATGEFVIANFSANNLKSVVIAIKKKKYPSKELIICADNDQYGAVNVGSEKTKEEELELE